MSADLVPSLQRPQRPADVPVPERLKRLPVDERGYPVLVTVPQIPGQVDFGGLSERRKLVVATYDLCGVCGFPFEEDELRWQVTFETPDGEDAASELDITNCTEAPVHRICALYAAQVCPFVSSPYARLSDDMRRGQRRGEALVLRGFRTTADLEVIQSELQPGVNILMFAMRDLAETMVLRNAGDAYEAYRQALVQDVTIEVDRSTETLVRQLSTPVDGEDSAGVMVGGAYIIGAAFLDSVSEVQSMGPYNSSSSYFPVAVAAVHDSGAWDWRSLRDPHLRAAMEWLNTRDTLPPILQRWRNHGRSKFRVERESPGQPVRPPASRRTAAATRRRKAQKAARRKNR